MKQKTTNLAIEIVKRLTSTRNAVETAIDSAKEDRYTQRHK